MRKMCALVVALALLKPLEQRYLRRRARSGRLSTQVLNEFYVNVTRKLKPAMPQGDARARVRRYAAGWNPWVCASAGWRASRRARHGKSRCRPSPMAASRW